MSESESERELEIQRDRERWSKTVRDTFRGTEREKGTERETVCVR